MSPLDLHLQPLQSARLSVPRLEKRIKELDRITSHLSEVSTIDTPNQIAELRKKVHAGFRARKAFKDYTSVPRRESLLLTLYLMDLASVESREKLPDLGSAIATSILGDHTHNLKRHLRRQATQLYFTHYSKERIKCLKWLTDRLQTSWRSETEDRTFDAASKAYRAHADLLFVADAPTKIATEWKPGESVDDLADRFGIPPGGEFRERLLEEVILERVRNAPKEGTGAKLDKLVADSKERRLHSGYPLGAEAVKILINRSISKFQSKVPSAWKEQLVTYACDPRVPSPAEQALWWGWSNQEQKNVAIRALTELTLRKFISLLEESLEGTAAEGQFERRANMLLSVFDLGKVIDARLAVHENTYHTLPARTRQALIPYRTSGGPHHTSFICLKCTDDVYLIEGTHSFALRGFLGADSFPVPSLWHSKPGTYFHDDKFRVPEIDCDIYQRHHVGDWLWDFDCQLRNHHIEWNGL